MGWEIQPEFETLLRRDKLRDTLNKCRRLFLDWRLQHVVVEGSDPEALWLQHPAVAHLQFRLMTSDLVPLFRSNIERHLPRPHVCTSDDIADRALEHLLVEDAEFDAAYERFVASVLSTCVVPSYSPSFPVYTGALELTLDENTRDGVTVWGNDSFTVRLVNQIPHGKRITEKGVIETGPLPDRWTLYAQVIGECSERALDQLQAELEFVLSSTLHTGYLLAIAAGESEPIWVNWDPEFQSCQPGLTGRMEIVPECLSSFYANPTKKDSIDRRIRNAIHFLVEADRQQSVAVGLALCVAAIEALLGRKGSDISLTLAENTATVLEPDPRNRAAAVEFVRQLYNVRSQVLHGTSVEGDVEARDNARLLASGVLTALFERRRFMQKMQENPETPDELMAELRGDKWTPGQTLGVTESPVRSLWLKTELSE